MYGTYILNLQYGTIKLYPSVRTVRVCMYLHYKYIYGEPPMQGVIVILIVFII